MDFKFFKNFGKKKFEDMSTAITEAIVRFDPDSASEAEIQTMNEKYVELSEKLERARVSMEKEEKEALVAKNAFNKRVDMLEFIKKKIEEGIDVEKNTEALNVLVEQLEEQQENVATEVQEAEDAKLAFKEIEEVVVTFGNKLKIARKALESAKKKMERAETQLLKAQQREEQAKELAGLKKTTSCCSTAFDAMTKQAEELEIKAKASNNRSEFLGSSTNKNSVLEDLEKEWSVELNTPVKKEISFKKF